MKDLFKGFVALRKAFSDMSISAAEATNAFKKFGATMSEQKSLPNACPRCMLHASWGPYGEDMTVCTHCGWRFDSWALRNNDFAELRAQVLEFQLREMELRRQRELRESPISQEEFEERMLREMVRPTPSPPKRNKTPAEMSVQERLIRAQQLTVKTGDLSDSELNELIEIASIASSEHPLSVGREGGFSRIPLTGNGISGDAVLMGNEERFELVDTGTTSNADGIEQNREMTVEDVRRMVATMEREQRKALEHIFETEYGRLHIYNDTNSEEPKTVVAPKKPLKRKLDL